MRKPARDKNGPRTPVSSPASLPAPIGGWNKRDSVAKMNPTDAVVLTNWFPATTECVLRNGYSEHATGLPGEVETLLIYSGAATEKMFAISDNAVYDVTSSGAVGAAVLSGLSNSRWQYCNVSTAGGNFLYMANGVDTPYLYNGTTWTSITGVSTPAITGVTTTALNSPILFKNRVIFLQKDTLKTWYLPTLSVGGAAGSIDVSSFAERGGYIVAHGTWTIDAGRGVDDHYVMVTNNGQVLVYAGTDPSTAADFNLVGIWDIGAPVGSRCLYKFAGDLLLISNDGIVPLSAALQSSRVNPRVAITDKIQWAVSEAVTSYGSTFGWQLIDFPKQNQLWLNVPASGGTQQFVMNTISKSWCNFTGWDANCFNLFQDHPYFGGYQAVYKAWDTYADNGTNINAYGLQAFNDFGYSGLLKRFTMTRPVFRSTGSPSVYSAINVDFVEEEPTSSLSFTPSSYGTWDSGTWDASIWGGGLSVIQNWQGVSGFGYYGAPAIKVASNGIDVRWVLTDVVIEKGAVL